MGKSYPVKRHSVDDGIPNKPTAGYRDPKSGKMVWAPQPRKDALKYPKRGPQP